MNYEDIIAAWNNQADKHNQWSDLGEDEKLEWAMSLEREACAKVCEQYAEHQLQWRNERPAEFRAMGANEAAEAIRARSE